MIPVQAALQILIVRFLTILTSTFHNMDYEFIQQGQNHGAYLPELIKGLYKKDFCSLLLKFFF